MADAAEAEVEQDRQLLLRADSLLSLVVFRHHTSGIPADLQEEARQLIGQLRAAYAES
jgi:hypothetical protein